MGESFSLQDIPFYDYVLFTSRNGVRHFTDQLSASERSLLKDTQLISVGGATTQSLNALGLSPVYESETTSAKGIIAYFKRNGITGKRILMPRSAIGIPALPQELRQMGNEVTDLSVYKTVTDEKAPMVEDLSVYDEILFSSPSGVRAFVSRYGKLPSDIPLTGKGETTMKEISDSLL